MLTPAPEASPQRRSLVIVATYNERDNLPRLLRRFVECCGRRRARMDDSSPGGTGDVADRITADDARLTVVQRGQQGGVASAHLLGFVTLSRTVTTAWWRSTRISPTLAGGKIIGRSHWHDLLTMAGCAHARMVLRLEVLRLHARVSRPNQRRVEDVIANSSRGARRGF